MIPNITLSIASLLLVTWIVLDKLQTARQARLIKQKARRRRVRERGDQLNRLANAVAELAALIPSLKGILTQSIGSTADANKFLAGTMTACETIATATEHLRETVASFSSLVVAPPVPGYPADAFQEPASEDHRQFVGDTFAQMIQHNIPEDMARQRVRDEEEKKTAISAVEFGQE